MDLMPFVSLMAHVAPGVLVGAVILAVLPAHQPAFRLVVYMLLFVLIRDAMTPLELWDLSQAGELRFIENGPVLVLLGLAALGLVGLAERFDPELRALRRPFVGSRLKAIAGGLVGAAAIAGPLIAYYHTLPPGDRLPAMPLALWPALLTLCLLGNFLEEALFRGWFQGLLARDAPPRRAALSSALFFAFFHVFLALTVTGLGWPIIAFTFYEGLIAAFVCMRLGLVAATLSHGVAIFLLAAGL